MIYRAAIAICFWLALLSIAYAQTGGFPGFLSNTITNPSSILTRPANTTAYAQNDLIASSATAGSVAVPSFNIATTAGGACLQRMRLITNITTGFDASTFTIRLWSAAPTYTNGDNGAYAVATGAAGFIGDWTVTLTQLADGAVGVAVPVSAAANWQCLQIASGTAVYWDLQYTAAGALTPISGQTFTLRPELRN